MYCQKYQWLHAKGYIDFGFYIKAKLNSCQIYMHITVHIIFTHSTKNQVISFHRILLMIFQAHFKSYLAAKCIFECNYLVHKQLINRPFVWNELTTLDGWKLSVLAEWWQSINILLQNNIFVQKACKKHYTPSATCTCQESDGILHWHQR